MKHTDQIKNIEYLLDQADEFSDLSPEDSRKIGALIMAVYGLLDIVREQQERIDDLLRAGEQQRGATK
jgi:hypothetical protein